MFDVFQNHYNQIDTFSLFLLLDWMTKEKVSSLKTHYQENGKVGFQLLDK